MSDISVIVPIYNVEKYLREALTSIVNQTKKELEIILVNDGSTDNSYEIAKEFEKKDPRIILLNKKNGGLSSARNAGLRVASSKYVYFFDSDDVLDSETLSNCYDFSEKFTLDVLLFDAERLLDLSMKKELKLPTYDRSELLVEKEVYKGEELLKKMVKNKIYIASACLQFIKREHLKSNMIEFYEGIIHEDELFTPQVLANANRCSYLKNKFFKRRIRENSIMSNLDDKRSIEGYRTTVEELIKKNNAVYNPIINNLFREIILKGEKRISVINLRKNIKDIIFFESNILYWTRILIGNFLTKNVYNFYTNFKSN